MPDAKQDAKLSGLSVAAEDTVLGRAALKALGPDKDRGPILRVFRLLQESGLDMDKPESILDWVQSQGVTYSSEGGGIGGTSAEATATTAKPSEQDAELVAVAIQHAAEMGLPGTRGTDGILYFSAASILEAGHDMHKDEQEPALFAVEGGGGGECDAERVRACAFGAASYCQAGVVRGLSCVYAVNPGGSDTTLGAPWTEPEHEILTLTRRRATSAAAPTGGCPSRGP
jgi:hypothetical protein